MDNWNAHPLAHEQAVDLVVDLTVGAWLKWDRSLISLRAVEKVHAMLIQLLLGDAKLFHVLAEARVDSCG